MFAGIKELFFEHFDKKLAITCYCHLFVEWFSEKKESENKLLFPFVQTYEKRKEVLYMEMSRDNDQKWKRPPYMEM